MLERLAAYRKRFGHCNVSTRDPRHAVLGRWVAAQRHKRKKGRLPAGQVGKLDAVGLTWSPVSDVWESLFSQLEAYAAENGHCNIPEHYPRNQKLASWAHSQRHRRRKGLLPSDRQKRLEAIGFQWAVYKGTNKGKPKREPQEPKSVLAAAPSRPEERLYCLRQGAYVQFNGEGAIPDALRRFVSLRGEMPPYIPLPRTPLAFLIGEGFGSRKMAWSGTGPLPPEVLHFVEENGCLPRHI
jgi:hypothetical protein